MKGPKSKTGFEAPEGTQPSTQGHQLSCVWRPEHGPRRCPRPPHLPTRWAGPPSQHKANSSRTYGVLENRDRTVGLAGLTSPSWPRSLASQELTAPSALAQEAAARASRDQTLPALLWEKNPSPPFDPTKRAGRTARTLRSRVSGAPGSAPRPAPRSQGRASPGAAVAVSAEEPASVWAGGSACVLLNNEASHFSLH